MEFPNNSPEPNDGASLEIGVEQLPLLDYALATWHTHPGATANLSVGDAETFTQWPNMLHAIVGTDGIRWYGVKNGAVINA